MSAVKIHSLFLDNIKWKNGTACDFAVTGKVDTWRINISANLPWLDDFLSLMDTGEISRAGRYLRQQDKDRFIISRGALRTILGKYLQQAPASIQFHIGKNKKPQIANTDKPFYYNISHSGDWILLAVSGAEVGADVEFINPEFDYQEVLQETFSPAEVDFIKEKPTKEAFYLVWTRKEALLKATAKGLDDELEAIPGLDGEHFVDGNVIGSALGWNLKSFNITGQYMATIACSSLISEFSFWDADLKQH
ncbi:hypothetical protein BH09BAC6_BH09BAC6_18750 [soil metagenome]|jgi:4'-phosphopantetheinyl transferase